MGTFLGILIYILAVMIFSEYAPARSTNWSIFYFSSVFISFIMISLNKIIKTFDKFTRLLLSACVIFFFVLLCQQLLLINKPYDYYYTSVNDNFIDNLRFSFLTVSISIISFKYLIKWVKQRKK